MASYSYFPVYSVPSEKTSPLFATAFMQGLQRHGIKANVEIIYREGTWAGFGSPRNWKDLQAAIAKGFDWWYADHGYLQRTRNIRVTYKSYQISGVGPGNLDRLKRLGIPIQPWRQSGSHVLVCPQSEVFFSLHNQDGWLENTLRTLRAHTDREIRVRYKEKSGPIQDDLRKAHCVVTYTSNCAIDAILSGVPAICTGQCVSSAMSTSDVSHVESLVRPDNRLLWAARLAANQWTLTEIRNGECWRYLQSVARAT